MNESFVETASSRFKDIAKSNSTAERSTGSLSHSTALATRYWLLNWN
jgi:hypothetical protein